MSLINDAIKRAHQAKKQNAVPKPAGPTLQPTTAPDPEPQQRSLVPLVLLGLVVMCLVGLGGWFFMQGLKAGRTTHVEVVVEKTPKQASTPAVVAPPSTVSAAQVMVPPPGKVALTASAQVAEKPAAAPSQVATPKPAANSEPVKAAVKPIPVEFPPLKLQGIYFRRKDPSAMVNGHNVYAGDIVEGVRVVAIERQQVVVELNGQRKSLSMP